MSSSPHGLRAPGEEGATGALLRQDVRRTDRAAGFTIVEVMIAMLILLVGVLGTLTMLEGSASSTARTSARGQGTNLARDLVERSRQASFADMSSASAPATLRSTLPASDAATALVGSTFQVTRRNVTYTVRVFACSVDDPTDGIGVGDATFCAGGANPRPGDPPSGAAAAVNVLGISVVAGGSLLQTVCNAIGPANPVTALVSAIAPISVCPSGSTNPTARYDSRPDDLRRVRVDVSWTRRGSGSVSQTTLLTNPFQS